MILVYLSPVPWDSIAQRPHFFVDYCLSNGFQKVVWIEPTPSRFPRFSDFKSKIIGVEADSFKIPEGVIIVKASAIIPVEPLNHIYNIVNLFSIKSVIENIKNITDEYSDIFLVCGKPSILAEHLINNFNFKKIIYDVMDDYSHFFTGLACSSMQSLLEKGLASADIVSFSSTNLYYKYKSKTKESLLVKNACSLDFYKKNHENTKIANTDTVVYGYVGSIAKWFDWSFVFKLAYAKPDSIIRIIGPAYTDIPLLPDNVFIESAIEHEKVAEVMKEFNYAIIPFKCNELTHSVDPVKYYEYVVSGLPIISTVFGEMKYRIENNRAVTLDMHLQGLEPVIDDCVFWNDRFNELLSYLR
ncbi:glycosyltransferase family 1 protein [Photobacterium damselae]|uniref:glycosyltransferase family 1 protein n=1 Tax=Photobacterium damselae TaxID=38293 RepID=UPI0010FE378C|nr:glycosyltransferase family 1 protein [Photobacterium damselae]TLS69846.1 glycosyltransferase family 1 protein [Photobacterium damselae subsp. damselae]